MSRTYRRHPAPFTHAAADEQFFSKLTRRAVEKAGKQALRSALAEGHDVDTAFEAMFSTDRRLSAAVSDRLMQIGRQASAYTHQFA